MWFLIGFLLGGRPSEFFGRALMLMLTWALPLGFGKLVTVNVVASLYVPAALAAYAAMIAFALYRPATSTAKLGLIEGSIMCVNRRPKRTPYRRAKGGPLRRAA